MIKEKVLAEKQFEAELIDSSKLFDQPEAVQRQAENLKFKKTYFRRALFQIHLWTGLLSGLLMAMFGATGSLIVFHREQDDVLNAKLAFVNPPSAPNQTAPLQAIVDAAKRAQPDLKIQSVNLPLAPERSVMIQMRAAAGEQQRGEGAPSLSIYVNPYTAEVIGERDRNQTALWWIRILHSNLHSGRTGRVIVGICGLLLALLCLSGIVIWFPGRQNLKRGLTINRRANWKKLNWDLHSAIGFYSLIFIFIIAITGSYYAWPQETLKGIYWVTNSAPRPEPPKSLKPEEQNETIKLISIDDFLKTADAALPNDRTTQIAFPVSPTGVLAITKQPPAEVSSFLRSRVFLDQYSGAVLSVEDAREAPLGAKIAGLITPLHFGTIGGIWTRILWLIVGLVLPLMFITGFLMWWNRVVRKRMRSRNE